MNNRSLETALGTLRTLVADRIGCLPACQAEALARVFDGNGAVEPFTLCTAVHALLIETARSGPVLCWVDDVHWLDRASLDAMTKPSLGFPMDMIAMVPSFAFGNSPRTSARCSG